MPIYIAIISNDAYLSHHGIRGQKWGVRRYQNMDKSLTEAGRIRYGIGQKRANKKLQEQHDKIKAAKKVYDDDNSKYKKYKNKWDETLDAYTDVNRRASEAFDKYSDYTKKHNSFHPDGEGPVFKNMKDFEKGIVDKKGTDLFKEYDRADEDLIKMEFKMDKAFDKMYDYENKLNTSLASLNDEQQIFSDMSEKYIKRYGKQALKDLKLDD